MRHLYDKGYKLSNVCPLNDAELVEWAVRPHIYRRSMPGTLELTPAEFVELKEAQYDGE